MRLENTLCIAASLERTWDFFMDIPAMSSCIPGVDQIRQIDDTSYAARIKQKVGPLSVTFDCQITILSIDEPTRAMSARVSGRDSKLGSGLQAVMSVRMEPDGDGVLLTMSTEADISGKIAQYGHGVIKQRATSMANAFGACVNEKIASVIAR